VVKGEENGRVFGARGVFYCKFFTGRRTRDDTIRHMENKSLCGSEQTVVPAFYSYISAFERDYGIRTVAALIEVLSQAIIKIDRRGNDYDGADHQNQKYRIMQKNRKQRTAYYAERSANSRTKKESFLTFFKNPQIMSV
jgi:hypothetical protein